MGSVFLCIGTRSDIPVEVFARNADDWSSTPVARRLRGLYQKALEIHKKYPQLRLVRREEIRAEEAEGFSPEERQHFEEQIDELLNQNRLAVTPETLTYTPQRRGIALPLVTNLIIGAVVVLALGAAFFWYNRQEQSIATGETVLLTAESKLIAALRQESEAQLKQKDQAILDIQGRLSAIDQERLQLRSGVQAALSAKEQELLGQFERRLREERQRLQGQGVSQEEIQRRLAETEAELRRDNEAALADARRQAEQELASREAAIASLAGQYQRDLEQARTERTQAQGEIERREAEMQRELAAREQELASDRDRVSGELSALRRQQEQERLLLDQLLTGYDRVNQSLQQGNYEQALAGLAAQRAFFDDRSVASLPAVQKRRAIEFFLIDSLEEMIRSRQNRVSTDTAGLLEASSLIAAAGERVRRGQELEKAGQTQAALDAYREALAQIPAVREGYSRVEALRAAEENLSEERSRREWGALVRQGNVFFEGGSFRESLQRYQQALSLLLQDEALSRQVTENIRDAGYRLLAAGDQGRRLTAEEQERLNRLTAVEQERDAALARLKALSSSEQERLNRVAAVEKERDAALARLNALSSSEQERLNRVAAVEKERDAALARLNALSSTQEARGAVLARLRELRVQYQAFTALVPSSAASELDSPKSLATLLQAKILVRQILDTEPVRSQYPELGNTMERYFTALAAQKEADGRRAALQELDAQLARLTARDQPSTPTFTAYKRANEPDPLLALFNRLEALLQ